jgi:hypothetical protein
MPNPATESVNRCVAAFDAMKSAVRPPSRADRDQFDNLQVESDGALRQLLVLPTLKMGVWLKTSSKHTISSTEFVRFIVWQDSTNDRPTRKYVAIEYHARKNRWILAAGATYDNPFFLRLFQQLDVTFDEVRVIDEATALRMARKINELFLQERTRPSS